MHSPRPVTRWTPSQVAALVRDRIDETVADTHWIGSGTWSDCFSFVSNGQHLVIRIGRYAEDFRLDQFIGNYVATSVPVPQTSLVAGIGHEFFAISEFVPGEPLEYVASWQDIVPAIVELLDALRNTDIADLGGWGRWTPTTGGQASTWRAFLLAVDHDPPGTRIHGWKERIATSASAQQAFDRGYALLTESIVDDVPRSLGHNDLLNRNVHVTGRAITGLFDWGNSILGDHLYDLATLCFWEPWLPGVQAQQVVDRARAQWSGQGDVLENFDDRLRSCLLHTALEHIAYNAAHDKWDDVHQIITRMDTIATHQW